MAKFFKKTAAVAMAGMLTLAMLSTAAGCAKEAPVYDEFADSRVLNIGAWVGPPSNETTQERYDEIAESGLNFIIDIYSGAVEQKLNYSQQAGIKYIMNGIYFPTYEGLAEYMDHPALMGIIGRDEPGVSAFEELAAKKESFKALYPDKLFFVNLLPSYATEAQLGTKFYTDYVSMYAETVAPELYVFDGYSLLKSSTGATSIESGMLFNLETVAMEAQEQGKPYWAFLQTMGYGGDRRNVTEADIRFQYYTYLSYGYSGLLHFCYWTPGGAEFPESVYAMIERDGSRTPTYDAVKNVNAEILNFDHVLLSYEWTGTMTVLGENELMCKAFQRLSSPLKEHEAIQSATASENAIIGTFKDGEYNGFMAVNFTDPALEKTNHIEIKFRNAKKALVYVDGQPQTVNLKGGVYSADLDPGEGRFIIPL